MGITVAVGGSRDYQNMDTFAGVAKMGITVAAVIQMGMAVAGVTTLIIFAGNYRYELGLNLQIIIKLNRIRG